MVQWIKSLFGPSESDIYFDKIHKESEERRKKIQAFFQNWQPLAIYKAEYTKDIMTVTYNDNTVKQYKGDCTVWHTYPMMERCNTNSESKLSDIWSYIKEHGNPYPTAHLSVPQGASKSQETTDPETAGHPNYSARNVSN
jgi:hypothetical protein